MCFFGIPGYPNPFLEYFRPALVNFFGNNVVSGEDHLKAFSNFMDYFEVEEEDVMMKLFMQSLTEDAREWYWSFPAEIINSWEEFKRLFREKYVDKVDSRYFLNQFNNIAKGSNESVIDFNTRFQKARKSFPTHLQ